jgi:hypothetical protein
MLDKCGSRLSFYGQVAKMVCDDYLKRGRALRIAVGITVMWILLLLGWANALSIDLGRSCI